MAGVWNETKEDWAGQPQAASPEREELHEHQNGQEGEAQANLSSHQRKRAFEQGPRRQCQSPRRIHVRATLKTVCWEVLAEGDMEARSGVSERGACGKGNTATLSRCLLVRGKKDLERELQYWKKINK